MATVKAASKSKSTPQRLAEYAEALRDKGFTEFRAEIEGRKLTFDFGKPAPQSGVNPADLIDP